MTPGLSAFETGAAIVDLSARGRIRVTGEDRARLLHAMTTNHVQQLKPGESLYAFFLNANGRVLADAHILCFEDHFLIDTGQTSRQLVFEHLDRYIIADDATLEDITEQTFCLGVEGPSAHSLLGQIALPPPQSANTHVTWEDLTLASVSATGAPAVRVYGPLAHREALLQQLEGAGAVAASDEETEMWRIRNFHPRHGVDFSEASLPQETQMMHALHFQKGCYLGQEIVERIRSRGHVNRELMGFRLKGEAPARGARIESGGKEAGEVTSAASFSSGMSYGLAMLRVPYNKPGSPVEIGGIEAEVFAPQTPELS